MSGRHVEDSKPPSAQQRNGEEHLAVHTPSNPTADIPCDHRDAGQTWMPCCHGGHGRHLAIPRHPVRWPAPAELAAMTRSSSQAGLASFRGAR